MTKKIQLRKIHEAYQQPEEFLVPGEIHGGAGELLEKLEVGDVITYFPDEDGNWRHAYDPELKIEGKHFVKGLVGDNALPCWRLLKPGVSLERRPREQSERRP